MSVIFIFIKLNVILIFTTLNFAKFMCQDSNSSFSEIYTTTDLKDLIKFGVINEDVVIRGGYIKSLDGVCKIEGSLGINDARLECLGDLNEITGNFWISYYSVFSRLATLGKLEIIGGNTILRYSNINNLGTLKKVEGKLSLRDTPIKDLGLLSYVGGDLYLPERLKEKLDLNQITVKGKIRFWKDSRKNKHLDPKENIGLIRHSESVPFWNNQYIYSITDIEKATIEQQQFYKIYKQYFKKGMFIDIEGNENYSYILFYDLMEEHSNNNNIKDLQEYLHNLGKYYPNTIALAEEAIIEKMECINDYETAWKLKCKNEYVSILTIIEYEKKLQRSLIDGELIVKLGRIGNLTNFGKSNIEKIKPFAYIRLKDYEKERGKSFFELFFRKHKQYHTNEKKNKFNLKYLSTFFKKSNPTKTEELFFTPDYYKHFFLNKDEYDFWFFNTFYNFSTIKLNSPSFFIALNISMWLPSFFLPILIISASSFGLMQHPSIISFIVSGFSLIVRFLIWFLLTLHSFSYSHKFDLQKNFL